MKEKYLGISTLWLRSTSTGRTNESAKEFIHVLNPNLTRWSLLLYWELEGGWAGSLLWHQLLHKLDFQLDFLHHVCESKENLIPAASETLRHRSVIHTQQWERERRESDYYCEALQDEGAQNILYKQLKSWKETLLVWTAGIKLRAALIQITKNITGPRLCALLYEHNSIIGHITPDQVLIKPWSCFSLKIFCVLKTFIAHIPPAFLAVVCE